MSKVSEQWSKANAKNQGRTDSNLSNDSNHLGGIPADEYATKEYVQEYHNTKEGSLKDYVDKQDQSILNEAKEYTNSQIRNQDFSSFAKLTDVQALDKKLSEDIEAGDNAQKAYTDQKTNAIVKDVNANFQDVENSINTLNGTVNELFQSVSSGKGVVAEAITDKGVPTSANDSFNTMATNIRAIPTSGGGGRRRTVAEQVLIPQTQPLHLLISYLVKQLMQKGKSCMELLLPRQKKDTQHMAQIQAMQQQQKRT